MFEAGSTLLGKPWLRFSWGKRRAFAADKSNNQVWKWKVDGDWAGGGPAERS